MDRNLPKTDGFNIFIRVMDIIVWSLIFAAMLFFDQARPETATILDARYSKSIRDTWDYTYASISMWIFIASAMLSSTGLLINVVGLNTRHHRISRGLSLALFLSLTASVSYMLVLL